LPDNFGLKIGIEGEKQFKNSLRDINQKFRVLGSEMKLVTAQFDKQDNSIEAVTARNKSLNNQIDSQKDKIGTLNTAMGNASKSFGDTDRRTQNWQIQLNKAKADLIKFEHEVEDNNKVLDGSADEFKDAGKQADEFGDEVVKSADQAETAGRKFDGLKSVLGGVAGVISGAVLDKY
jgi:chromosome segregation ATPase